METITAWRPTGRGHAWTRSPPGGLINLSGVLTFSRDRASSMSVRVDGLIADLSHPAGWLHGRNFRSMRHARVPFPRLYFKPLLHPQSPHGRARVSYSGSL